MDMNKQISCISSITGRNVIAYYSDFCNLKKKGTEMDYTDMPFFINAVRKMDRQRGLDLLLHTGAGDLMFTENLVKYLHTEFGRKVRIIIPEMVAREGTMLACAGEKILMNNTIGTISHVRAEVGGKPVDKPLEELRKARTEIEDLQQKYDAAYLKLQGINKKIEEAKLINDESTYRSLRKSRKLIERFVNEQEENLKAVVSVILNYRLGAYHKLMDIEGLNKRLIKEWLLEYQLTDPAARDTKRKAKKIADTLTGKWGLIQFHECQALGLNVEALETDNVLSTAVNELHNEYLRQFKKRKVIKIIASSETDAKLID